MGTTIVPAAFHVQMVGALQGNSADAAYFFIADRTHETDLAGHGCTTDDRFVQAEFLDESRDATDVGVFGVGVAARMITFVGEGTFVGLEYIVDGQQHQQQQHPEYTAGAELESNRAVMLSYLCRYLTHRKIESSYATLLSHAPIIHHAIVLSPIGASSVQEDNLLVALAALLMKDLSFSPERNSRTLRQM